MKAGAILKSLELFVGDVVKLVSEADGGWDTCIVQKIDEDFVYFWRPYGHVSDFTMGDSVICYVGFEEFNTFRNGSFSRWKLLQSRRERQ